MSARTTRRALFGASAAALALFGAAGESKAAELDGRLLALVAELEDVQAEIAALCAEDMALLDAPDKEAASQRMHELDDIIDAQQVNRFWPLADEIEETSARTPEGIQAKAKALRIVLDAVGQDEGPVSRHMLGLVRDVLGEG